MKKHEPTILLLTMPLVTSMGSATASNHLSVDTKSPNQISHFADCDRSLKVARSAVQCHPESAIAHLKLAANLQYFSNYQPALHEYEEAIKHLNPVGYNHASKDNDLSWKARLGIIQCLVMLDHEQRAISLCRTFPAPQMLLATTSYCFADTCLQLKLDDLAKAHLERCLTESPDKIQISTHSALESLYIASLRSNKVDRALEIQSTVMAGKPQNRSVYESAVEYYSSTGKEQECRTLIAEAHANMSYCGDLFWTLNKILSSHQSSAQGGAGRRARLKWLKLAELSLKFAIEADPNENKFRVALADNLDKQHRFVDGLRALAETNPNRKNALSDFAAACLFQKQNDIAARIKRVLIGQDARNDLPIALQSLTFRINKLSCGCRYSAIACALQKHSDVVRASFSKSGTNKALLIYRPTTLASGIIRSQLKPDESLDVICTGKIRSLAELTESASQFDTTNLQRHYSFQIPDTK
ncbi:MAG TPA: hypothetical protein V6C89_21390 [Drouetiella sp.]|jgi:hypothetical protein